MLLCTFPRKGNVKYPGAHSKAWAATPSREAKLEYGVITRLGGAVIGTNDVFRPKSAGRGGWMFATLIMVFYGCATRTKPYTT